MKLRDFILVIGGLGIILFVWCSMLVGSEHGEIHRKDYYLQEKIMKLLKKRGYMERDMMAIELGVARSTLYDNLKIMKNVGLVDESKRYKPTKHIQGKSEGRPKTIWYVKKF